MSEPVYDNPLISRYASREMAQHFSTEHRIRLWRELWIVLAEFEKDLGLPISDAQIAQLKAFRSELNLDVANAYERKLRHDMMAQVHAYGDSVSRCSKDHSFGSHQLLRHGQLRLDDDA
jgi:adenylosuccinate lyase